MAMLMKTIMDAFYDLRQEALKEEKYESAFVYSIAENMANNCHGRNPAQIRE